MWYFFSLTSERKTVEICGEVVWLMKFRRVQLLSFSKWYGSNYAFWPHWIIFISVFWLYVSSLHSNRLTREEFRKNSDKIWARLKTRRHPTVFLGKSGSSGYGERHINFLNCCYNLSSTSFHGSLCFFIPFHRIHVFVENGGKMKGKVWFLQ